MPVDGDRASTSADDATGYDDEVRRHCYIVFRYSSALACLTQQWKKVVPAYLPYHHIVSFPLSYLVQFYAYRMGGMFK